MPVIKVTDMAYGKLRSPDLDAQEEFLTHFGMVRRTGRRTRSTCGGPILPITST